MPSRQPRRPSMGLLSLRSASRRRTTLTSTPAAAVASMRPLTRSNSALVAISGTITSRPTGLPVRLPASTAASKIARDCISAISG